MALEPRGATPSRLKYLKCECCSFLAVIPRHDRHEGLLCPFCTKVQCAHGGKFFEVTRDTFENEADLDTPRSESARPEFEVQLPDGDNRPIKVWFMERQPNGKWRISITVDETPRSATAESDPVKALAANLTETDAARWRFVARMWPIDLLMLLNSHMDGLDDMLVGEAVDKAIAADIPRHK